MNRLVKRILMSVFGVLLGGFSVGIFKTAALGVDPFQTFMAGLDSIIPLQFGILYLIANAVLLLFSLIFDRHYINLATFINLLLLGYVTQFSYGLLQQLLPDPSLAVRIACLVVGIVIICIASSLYMTADLGVSTYDAVALIISETWKIGQFKFVRIITGLGCVAIGAALFIQAGNSWKEIPTIAGIGTLITAFFMGPLIEFFNRTIARPMLNGKNGTGATEGNTGSSDSNHLETEPSPEAEPKADSQ